MGSRIFHKRIVVDVAIRVPDDDISAASKLVSFMESTIEERLHEKYTLEAIVISTPSVENSELHFDEDSDGEPCVVRAFYECPNCGNEWNGVWSCSCDDECPSCGERDCSPFDSHDLVQDELESVLERKSEDQKKTLDKMIAGIRGITTSEGNTERKMLYGLPGKGKAH